MDFSYRNIKYYHDHCMIFFVTTLPPKNGQNMICFTIAYQIRLFYFIYLVFLGGLKIKMRCIYKLDTEGWSLGRTVQRWTHRNPYNLVRPSSEFEPIENLGLCTDRYSWTVHVLPQQRASFRVKRSSPTNKLKLAIQHIRQRNIIKTV